MREIGCEFWKEFASNSVLNAERIVQRDMTGAFKSIEGMLARHGFDLCFDLTWERDCAALILTPESSKQLALVVDSLLDCRPPIAGWVFYGRRQRKRFGDVVAFIRNIYGVNIELCTFDLSGESPGFRATMFCDDLNELEPDEVGGLVATTIEHLLGECVSMNRIASSSGRAGAGSLTPRQFVEAVDQSF